MMEDISVYFWILWMLPLVVNVFLLKGVRFPVALFVILLTLIFSWAVTTILACRVCMESPSAFRSSTEGLDVCLLSMGECGEYAMVCDPGVFSVAIKIPGGKNGDLAEGARGARESRKDDPNYFPCGCFLA